MAAKFNSRGQINSRLKLTGENCAYVRRGTPPGRNTRKTFAARSMQLFGGFRNRAAGAAICAHNETGSMIFLRTIASLIWVMQVRTMAGVTHEKPPVEIQMRNVDFRLAKNIILEVRALRGRLRPTKPDQPVTFDDSSSFLVEIDSAEVALSPATLTALFNSYVLADPASPIKNVTVSVSGDRVIQKGTLHKGIDLPFEIEGVASATPEGDIRVHADKIKAAHVPVKGLLHLFGENLGKLANAKAERGMRIAGDDIILTPRTLTPPPHLAGRVTRVSIAGGKIVEVFNSGRRPAPLNPPFPSTAYIYHRGGILRFGKLTMDDADLEIVGDRPGVFDFFQREYQKQLVAGYSKNTPANGLVVHMADYRRVESRGSPAGSANSE
jgi:hypothetical protein